MNARLFSKRPGQRGAGLVEVMVSIVIGLLLVLVIYQVYQVSEGQKRTITSGSDAAENASFAMFLLGRDVSIAGSGIASSAVALDGCSVLAPFSAAQLPGGLRSIPVVIKAGATGNDPDQVTVFFGGSNTLSTPVQFRGNSAPMTVPYQVAGAVGFSENDVIAAVSGATCTLSTINAGGVSVVANSICPPTCEATTTITHTPVPGSPVVNYTSVVASLVNLGPKVAPGTGQPALARVVYTVDANCSTDATKCTLRTQNLLPLAGPLAPAPVVPIVADVVNLKALYGLDINNDGIVDAWVPATGAWSFATLTASPGPALATLQQIRAVRIAIVTRSAQYDADVVTPGPLTMFGGADAIADGVTAVSMTLSGDQTHYRYKVFETVIPLRNAMWNS